jgi:hypothetical protein
MGCRYSTLIWDENEKILLLTVSWKPFTNDKVMIMAATLIIVATIDKRIIKRENDFCWLKAILRAINDEISTVY